MGEMCLDVRARHTLPSAFSAVHPATIISRQRVKSRQWFAAFEPYHDRFIHFTTECISVANRGGPHRDCCRCGVMLATLRTPAVGDHGKSPCWYCGPQTRGGGNLWTHGIALASGDPSHHFCSTALLARRFQSTTCG